MYNRMVESFYNSPALSKLLNQMCGNSRYVDDLKQELFIHLLSLDMSKQHKLIKTNGFLFYSFKFLKNQYHSSSSPFFRKYRNFEGFSDGFDLVYDEYDNKNEIILDKVEDVLNNKINFIDSFLFRKYYYDWDDNGDNKSGRSYRNIETEYSLSQDFKIDHTYIYNRVKKTYGILMKDLGLKIPYKVKRKRKRIKKN